jgi:hypothetical protein
VNLPYFDKELILLKVERKNFQSTLKKKKFEYYNKLIEAESLSSKKLWQFTSAIINPNKKSIIIPNLILKGHVQNTTLDAANQFIHFFSSIFVKFIFIPIAFCLTFLENHFNKNMKI